MKIAALGRIGNGAFLTFCMAGILLIVAAVGITTKPWTPVADETQYLTYAYNLHHHGTYSLAAPGEPLTPSAQREPGYPAFIAMMLAVDPRLRTYTPKCFKDSTKRCDPAIYRSLQWANVIMMGLAALFVGFTAFYLTNRRSAGVVAGGAIILNFEALSWRYTMMSDYLSLLLIALLTLLIVRAYRESHINKWVWAGLVLALLALTKAIFLYLILGVTLLFLVILYLHRASNMRRTLRLAGTAFLVSAFLPVLAWMSVNKAVIGQFSITDGTRMGVVLSAREIYNDMTAGEWATSFLWWTRGFGDNLARKTLPETVTHRLNGSVDNGFYKLGHSRAYAMSDRLVRTRGIDHQEANKTVRNHMIARIIERPFKHAVTTIPLFYKGIWIDEFAILSLPSLFFIALTAWRRRDKIMGLALAPGVFSLFFYAAASINIPRYQLSAIPVLALALGIAISMFLERRFKRRV